MKKEFSYGERLRYLRQERGFSQEYVALEADITASYYGQIERGTANPTISMLEKICAVLGVSLAALFTKAGADQPNLDPLSAQILYRLKGKTDREKELILTIIKAALKLQSENK